MKGSSVKKLVVQNDAISRAMDVLGATQTSEGAWKGDYGGPLFLVPVYVAGFEIMGRTLDAKTRAGFTRYLRGHQRPDGSWGLDVESQGHVFTTVLNYVALRLMGVSADDEGLRSARAWALSHGGPLGSGSWGKFILTLLGLHEYDGLHPVPPELWLLPKSVAFHPSKFWCHCRMVYLPMAWLYGRKARAKETPLLAAIRHEIYDGRYDSVDWRASRDQVAKTDAYTPRSPMLKGANVALDRFERFHLRSLREIALARVLEQIRGEDDATNYICIGPINKVLNTVVWHFANPDGPEVEAHLERIPDYLYDATDGLKVNGYNSSELWDTTFAVQALLATGRLEEAAPILSSASHFIEANQVLEDSPDAERFDRTPSRGGWPFSTRAHGWPISDCTGEGLKTSLLLARHGLNRVSQERLDWAADFIVSLQNEDGGWATYEPQRAPAWLEMLNPSDVFGEIMVDSSYVECTSSCLQALALYRDTVAPSRRARINAAIRRGEMFLRNAQRPDGSWEGLWGVCFSYGTWFAVLGLKAVGVADSDDVLTKAASFLRAHQRADGAWSETAESCRQRRWVSGVDGHAVNTAWCALALTAMGEGKSEPVRRAMSWLEARQNEDGSFPAEPLAGVFNKTCAIHYDAYLKVFPMWAMAEAAAAQGRT